MSNLNLANSDVLNVYKGDRKALLVFLGTNILHVNDAILYTARDLSTLIDITISAGTASLPSTVVLSSPGAST